jgi:hypothetical protein
MAQQQVLKDEVLAQAHPGQDGREQQPEQFEHTLSITDLWRATFCLPTTGHARQRSPRQLNGRRSSITDTRPACDELRTTVGERCLDAPVKTAAIRLAVEAYVVTCWVDADGRD